MNIRHRRALVRVNYALLEQMIADDASSEVIAFRVSTAPSDLRIIETRASPYHEQFDLLCESRHFGKLMEGCSIPVVVFEAFGFCSWERERWERAISIKQLTEWGVC